MAVDCSNVPTSHDSDCTNPWGQNCTSERKFQFISLWSYTQNIQQACANDARLFVPHGGVSSPQNASLTQEACAAIAGSDWEYYPAADIWTRLTTWKFPLLQLVASFPRPPLNLSVECFVILHLLGDPIDTLRNLLAKMSTCQLVAERWRLECEELLERLSGEDEDRDWKALTLLTDAYGEWGVDGQAENALADGLRANLEHKNGIATAIRQTGRALAADRSTKFFPIIVAQAFFIGAVGIAIFKTKSAAGANASSDTIFINVEAHSIAFSALYFWIIPIVFVGSIIGVSQTEAAIPRILKRFQVDLDRLDLPNEIKMPNERLGDDEQRIFHGGIYSWQPQMSNSSATFWTVYNVVPLLVVIVGTVTGMLVSGFVPPDGWDCRSIGELLISVAWFLSAGVDLIINYIWPLNKRTQNRLFWTMLIKDSVATAATMGGIITTQVGIFNRCDCYTNWGSMGLALPQMSDIAETLFRRLSTVYPAITFTGIGIQLIVVPVFLCTWYIDAVRTFVQRDDRGSNAAWLWRFLKWCGSLKPTIGTMNLRNPFNLSKLKRTMNLRNLFNLSKLKRTDTVKLEEMETQPLTHIVSGGAQSIATEDESPATLPVDEGHSGSANLTSETQGVNLPSGSGTKLQSSSEGR